MRLASENRRWVALILVVGVLAVALAVGCTDGLHLPFTGAMDGSCLTMSHTSGTVALAASDSSVTIVPLLALIAVVAADLWVLFRDPARFAIAATAPSPPPDPRFGRLRI